MSKVYFFCGKINQTSAQDCFFPAQMFEFGDSKLQIVRHCTRYAYVNVINAGIDQ